MYVSPQGPTPWSHSRVLRHGPTPWSHPRAPAPGSHPRVSVLLIPFPLYPLVQLKKYIYNSLSKGMSNVYLNVIIEETPRCQNFDFRNLKNCHQVSFWEALTHVDIIEFENFLLQLWNQRSGSEILFNFSIILILKGIMTF